MPTPRKEKHRDPLRYSGADFVKQFESEYSFTFDQSLKECLARAFDASKKPEGDPLGVTTDRVFVSMLILGKQRPELAPKAARIYQAVGETDFEKLKLMLTPAGVPSHEVDIELEDGPKVVSDTFRVFLDTAWKNREPKSKELTLDQLADQFICDPGHVSMRYLFGQTSQKWEDIAVSILHLAQASDLPGGPLTARSARMSDWKNHLESRYNARFSPDGVELIAAAAAQSQKIPDRRPMPSGILNTRDFLHPMFLDSQLLKSLIFQGSITSTFGGITPPWVEEMCERDSTPNAQLAPGNLLFSRHVEEALKGAARLAASTSESALVDKWLISGVILASNAPGIATSLAEDGISRGHAFEVFLRNLEKHDPNLSSPAAKILIESEERITFPSTLGGTDVGSEPNHPPSSQTSLDSLPVFSDLASLREELTGDNLESFDRFGREHATNLSLSCRKILLLSWEMASRLEEIQSSSSVSPGMVYLAFLMTGIAESREPYSESSLSFSVVDWLSISESDLLELHSRYRELAKSSQSSVSGVKATNGAISLWKEATAIRDACTPGEVIAARHLLGAFLRLYRNDQYIRNELSALKFVDESILLALQEHLEFYATTDRGDAWAAKLSEDHERPSASGKPPTGNEFQPKREAHDEELCLNVDAYAHAVAQLLRDADKENDFVLAIYGPWGRGKTTLMRKVKPLLAPSSNSAETVSYSFVDFSAWKYPTRPEVWIHLYEQIAQRAVKVPVKSCESEATSSQATPATKSQTDDASRKPEPFVDSFWQKSRLAFRMGLLRSGWSPLLTGLIFLFITRLPLVEAVEWLRIGLGGFGALLLIGFAFSAFQFGRRLRMRYLSLPDHSESLGMQAVIGRDLANLLQVWLAPASANEPVPGQINFRPGKPGFWGTLGVVLLIAATFVVAGLRIPHPAPAQGGSLEEPAGAMTSPSTPPQAPGTATPGPTTAASQTATSSPTPATSTPTPATSSPAPATSPPASIEATAPAEAAPAPSPAPPDSQVRNLLQQWLMANPPLDTLQGPAPSIESETPPSPLAYWISVSVLSLAGFALICFFISLSRPLIRHEKLLLTIDDLDRCEPDQMLAVIESLRLFLDNVQISRRLQVVMLVDQRFLGNALLKRARENGLSLPPGTPISRRFVREQREKFFVAELGLPLISPENLSEMIDKHLRPGEPERSEYSAEFQHTTPASKTNVNSAAETTPQESKNADGTAESNQDTEKDDTNPAEALPKKPHSESKVTADRGSKDNTGKPEDPLADPVGFSTKTIQSVRFSQAERSQLLSAIAELHLNEPTPRQVRASVVRYQLARMLLHHLGRPMTEHTVPEILRAIGNQLNGTVPKSSETIIDQVAHSVVCPDTSYSSEETDSKPNPIDSPAPSP